MLDLAEIGNAGDFQSLYEDLKNPACLNRMDKNGNIELINDDGFGAASTQYLWRFSEYNGKLVIGTFDIATLASGFTQLTDGSLLEMTPEEFSQKMTYVKELLKSLKKSPSKVALAAEENTADDAQDDAKDDVLDDTQANVLDNAKDNVLDDAQGNVQDKVQDDVLDDAKDDANDDVKDEDTTDNDTTAPEVTTDNVELTDEEADAIDQMLDQLDEIEMLSSEEASYLDDRSAPYDIVDVYLQMVDNYNKIVKPILHRFNPDLEQKIENNVFNTAFHHFVYYLGCSNIISTQEKGCDILISSDGVNFTALTRNGFGDIYNHGGRAFIPTDNGLFLGMANPFWGTQLWKITDGSENPTPDKPGTDKPDPDKPGTDKPGTDKPGTDKPGTDKPGTDTPGTDKPGSDKVDNNNNNKPTISGTSANTTTNNKNKNTNGKVKTGDNSHMALYTVSLLLSLMVVAGCIIMSRKRRNR